MEIFNRLRRLLIAGAPRPRDPLATLLTLAIAGSAAWSGLIHLSLGSLLFTLNGLGFLGNAALLTIGGYLADGAPRSSSAIAALFAEGGIIVGAAALWLAYRRAYDRRVAANDEPAEHWVSEPSIAPFLLSALAGGLFFFLAANPWAEIRCEIDPSSDAQIAACDLLFDRPELTIVADTPTTLRFENRVAIPHNIAIHAGDATSVGVERWRGALLEGPASVVYELPALSSGRYAFVCSIHPTMAGDLIVAP
jgi:plastocyanin